MFQDHYLKITKDEGYMNPIDSQVYAAIPDNRLLTENDILLRVQENKDCTHKSVKVVTNSIQNLLDAKRLKKIIGVHLWRFARNF